MGGPQGYENLLEALADSDHPRHDEFQRCIGRNFDPERFDPASVRFEDPARRLREVYDFA